MLRFACHSRGPGPCRWGLCLLGLLPLTGCLSQQPVAPHPSFHTPYRVEEYSFPIRETPTRGCEALLAFITPDAEAVRAFLHRHPDHSPVQIYDALAQYGLHYALSEGDVHDLKRRTAGPGDTIHGIQYPATTLAVRKGDCKDLTTTYASLLAAHGIPITLVAIPGRLFLLLDSGLNPETFETDPAWDNITYVTHPTSPNAWVPVDPQCIGSKDFHASNLQAYQSYIHNDKKILLNAQQPDR